MNRLFPPKIFFILSSVLCFPCLLFGQDDGVNPADIDTIVSTLNRRQPYPCLTEEIVNFDKVKHPVDPSEGGFEDPYNTLTHCFVFTYYRDSVRTGEPKPKLSVGIFRNGVILAHLDTAIFTFASTSGRIKTIADLNKDGEVDIVITRTLGASPPPSEEYWIFSWDGKRLRLISAVDQKMKHSVLRSPWDYLKFYRDSNGIYQLVTNFQDENGVETEHVYSWNGHLYGEWGTPSK